MRIHSAVTESLPRRLLAGRPPYRSPHHQASAPAILGSPEAPGELALAHGGVLFLDEMPEFRRDLLEALREPLEAGEVQVARARRRVSWRTRVLLVAACNDCPCGWRGSARRRCECSHGRVVAYQQRLSGPILERIDLHVRVAEPRAEASELFVRLGAPAKGRGRTARLRERVAAARAFARARNEALGCLVNGELRAEHLVVASGHEPAAFAALVDAATPRGASPRSLLRCLRVARTLADLGGEARVRERDLAQAWRWQAEAVARAAAAVATWIPTADAAPGAAEASG
jgi:magnesium chelatase family protein